MDRSSPRKEWRQSYLQRWGEGFSGYRHTRTRPIYRCDVRRRTHPHANETFLLFCFIFIFPKSSNSKSSTSLSQEKSQFQKVLHVTSPQTLMQRDSYKSNPLSRSSPRPPCTATASLPAVACESPLLYPNLSSPRSP